MGDYLDDLYTGVNPIKTFIYIIKFWQPVWSVHHVVPKTSLICTAAVTLIKAIQMADNDRVEGHKQHLLIKT